MISKEEFIAGIQRRAKILKKSGHMDYLEREKYGHPKKRIQKLIEEIKEIEEVEPIEDTEEEEEITEEP